MAVSREFRDFIEDLLSGFAAVEIRPMFGGAGIKAEGMNFALIIDDTLYFKTDERNRAAFEAEGMSPFAYQAKGKPVTTSYWRVPDRLLEDPAEIVDWAREAFNVAKAKRR